MGTKTGHKRMRPEVVSAHCGPARQSRKPVGAFNNVEIDVKGGDMIIKLTGTVVSTVGECELTEGASGLQSEGAETHWRNIRIRQR
jgi:hypothetical protein